MKTFLYLCLVVLSPILYIALSPMFSFYQYYPVLALLGMTVGIVLLVRLMNKQFTKLRLVAVVFSGLVSLLFLWYSFSYSEYANATSNLAVGKVIDEDLKDIQLTAVSGAPFQFGEFIEKSNNIGGA